MAIARRNVIPAVNDKTLVIWINRGLEALWLLAVVLVPLAFVTPDQMISAASITFIEVPKIALLRTLVGLMAVLWLIEWAIEGRFAFPSSLRAKRPQLNLRGWVGGLGGWLRGHPERWLILAVGFFLGTTLLSTVLSASFDVSMWGEVPGEDGYATYTVVAYVLLFAVVATHLKTAGQVWRLLGAIVIMGVLVASYAILQHYGHPPFDIRFPFLQNQGPFNMGEVTGPQGRAPATMGNPILAGAVMLMTISTSLTVAVVSLRQPLKTAGFWWKLGLWTSVLTVQFLAIIFTTSRGPWFGTTLALAGFLVIVFMSLGWRFFARTVLVLGLAVIITAAVLVLPSRLGENSAPPAPASVSVFGETEERDGAENLASAVSSEVSQILASINSQTTGRGLTGRMEIWKESGRLIIERPWFGFDNLSLSYLRPIIGYGPDLFRYTYLLESPPRGPAQVPRGSVHAHNFFIHQGVETGFLGLLSSLGIFVVPLLVGSYMLVRKGQNYSVVHKLVLAGLLVTVAGRLLEQMVGLARVSDLTIFWVLLAAVAVLSVAMASPQGLPESPRDLHVRLSHDWRRVWPVLAVVCLIMGIGALTWVKTINYPRAAAIAASAVKQSRDGDLQGALFSFNRAIHLAPDVWINYNRRANVYLNYMNDDQVTREAECNVRTDSQPYKKCLVEKGYLENLAGAEQRPFNFRSRHALALSASALATLSADEDLETEALRFFQEVTELVPTGWPLYNQLAFEYLTWGNPEAALGPLEKSLAITGDNVNSVKALLLRGIAYRQLGRLQEAISEFDDLLRLSPDDILAYNHQAMTYLALSQPQQALRDLDDATQITPNYAEAHSNRGFIQRQLGQPQSVIVHLNEAIRLDPQFEAAYNNRGLAHSDLGNYQRAIEDYDEAIRLNANYLQAYLNRGVVYVNLGQPDSALQDSEQALKLDPLRASAYALRAMAYTQLGVDLEATQDLARAVDLGFSRTSLEARIEDLKNRR